VRAVVVDGFGEESVARLDEVPQPRPGADQVRVRVAYASVNPADRKCQLGWMLPYPQFRPQLPFVLGFDGAGVVDAIGADVASVRVGDRVVMRVNQMAGMHGTFADQVCVTASDTAPMPDGLDFLTAATVPVAGVTAWQLVTRYGRVASGQHVLVNGGAGGVGSYAIQFARNAGAHVAATCGPANLDYLTSLGCELAIDYRNSDVGAAVAAWSGGGLDVLLDAVNIDGLAGAHTMLRPGGSVVGVVTLGAQRPYQDAGLAGRGARHVEATVARDEARADMTAIGEMLAGNAVVPPAIEVVPLESAAEALRRIGAGHVRGKLVLAVAPERV
jgi:NADPH:quinone reductase-like Zn-dependent oxidoreductase